jgi:hypothetical protein
MRIGRVIVIPAILALAVAGSALAGSAAPAAGHFNNIHLLAQAPAPAVSGMYYHT